MFIGENTEIGRLITYACVNNQGYNNKYIPTEMNNDYITYIHSF